MTATLERPAKTKPIELDDETLAKAQRDYAQALDRITAHAEINFRHIKDPGRRDDSIANTIGIGWKHWLAAVRQGKDPNEFVGAVADFAVRQVRSGRRLDRQEAAKDAMSPRAQRTKGFTMQSLPEAPDAGVDENDAIDALCDNSRTPPPEQAAFREQWGMFLDEMGPKKRPIVEDLAAGGDTKDLAEKHRVTPGRISQIRREAEQTWRRIDGDGEDRGR